MTVIVSFIFLSFHNNCEELLILDRFVNSFLTFEERKGKKMEIYRKE